MKGGGWKVSAEQLPHLCLVEGSLTDWALTLCPVQLAESPGLSGPQCSLGNGNNNNNNRRNDRYHPPHRVVVRLK